MTRHRNAPAVTPALDELRRVSYHGIAGVPGTPALTDEFHIAGDLDGDGRDEAVVLLTQSGGGTGSWSSLAMVKRIGSGLVNVATVALGDRVQLRAARIEGGRLMASVVRAGPHDPACCPGELVEWTWVLRERRLDAVDSAVTGRLSLATLAGSTWVLRAWNPGDPAPAQPPVTLTYAAGRLSGSSGCNRYTAGATEGAMPGEFFVSPPAGTRMACPDAESTVELRFLQQLAAARRFGFRAGRLVISNGAGLDMLFDAAGPLAAP